MDRQNSLSGVCVTVWSDFADPPGEHYYENWTLNKKRKKENQFDRKSL